MKRIQFILVAMLLTVSAAFGQTIVEGGLKYTVIDDENNKVSVEADNHDELMGIISISNEVFDEYGNLYEVVEVPEGAFANCYGVTELYIPNSVQRIAEGALSGCSNLTLISLPFVGTESYDLLTQPVFKTCFNSIFGRESFPGSYSYDALLCTSNAVGVGWVNLVMPQSLRRIFINGGNVCASAFAYLPNFIEEVSFGDNVTFTGFSLDNCNSKKITFYQAYTYYHIGHNPPFTLNDNHLLVEFVINDLESWCQSGLSVEGSNADIFNYNVFYSANYDSTRVVIKNSQHVMGLRIEGEVEFPEGPTNVMGFQKNQDITAVTLPSTLTGPCHFEKCNNLKTVTFREGATTAKGFSMSGVEKVNLPNTIRTIGGFDNCLYLQGITLPASIEEIQDRTFEGCENLATIVVMAETPPALGVDAIPSYVQCIVPKESFETYAIADGWNVLYSRNQLFADDGSHTIKELQLNDGMEFLSLVDKWYPSIVYNRNFPTCDWESLYIPFAMNYDDWKDEFEIARVNAFHQYDDNEDGVIDRTVLEAIKVKQGSTLANYPYLIRAKEPGEKSFTLDDVQVAPATKNSGSCSTLTTTFSFVGSYKTEDFSSKHEWGKTRYGMVDGKLQRLYDEDVISSFRWYINVENKIPGAVSYAPQMRIVMVDNGETDIEEVSSDQNEKQEIYSIDGRRVSRVSRPGIYVRDGKKLVFK